MAPDLSFTRSGDTWIRSDGRTCPVIEGGDGPLDAAADAVIDAGDVTPDPAGDVTPAGDPTPDPDMFPRDYVEELRKENAGYRTRAKTYEDAFDGLSDADQATILELAKRAKQDPREVAAWMREQANAWDPADGVDPLGDPEGEPQFLTKADLDAELSARAEADRRQAQISAIEKQAADLGYELDSEDYVALMHVAVKQTAGDIAKAHEHLEAKKRAAVDAWLASKAAETDATPTPPMGGSAPGSERPIRTLAEAEAAMKERLAHIPQ